MDAVRGLAGRATVILISHRLANVVGADEIFVLDGGRVVEHGRHDELVAADGRYATLWRAQRELEEYGAVKGTGSFVSSSSPARPSLHDQRDETNEPVPFVSREVVA